MWTERFPTTRPSPRAILANGYLPNSGLTLIFGGQDDTFQVVGDTWAWDGQTWRRLNLPNSPPARTSSQAATAPTVRGILIFGGLAADQSTYLDDTWIFRDRP